MPTTYFVSPTGSDTNSGLTAGAPKTLAGGLSAAAGGDTISMADGTYPRLDVSGKTLHFVATTPPTAKTVPGFSGGHPALQTRGVIINEATIADSADSTFTNLWFRWNKWVDTTAGETFESVYGAAPPRGFVLANSGAHAPVFTGCEFSWGYGASQDPFDTATVYPEFQSGAYATVYPAGVGNVTGRGDAYQSWWIRDDVISGTATPANTAIPNGRAYNTIAAAPWAFYMGNYQLRAPKFYACHFHDLNAGMLYYCDKGPFVVDQCWFERIYVDAMTGGQGAYGLGSSYGLQVTRTVMEKPFGQAADSSNPHSDFVQTYSNWQIPNPQSPMRYGNVWLERNFGLVRPTDRGMFQFLFLQGAAGHDTNLKGVVYWNPIVRDNATLQHNSDKGLLLDSVHDGLVEYNCLLPNPAATSSAGTQLNLTENANTKASGVALVRHNIVEIGSLLATAKAVDNVAVGSNYGSVAASSLMQGPFNFTGSQDTAANWYAAMTRQAAFSGRGPRFSTLESLVTQALDTSNAPLFVGWADQRDLPLSTTVTTDASVIRGPLGTSVDISVDSGEFQVEDISGAVLNAWRSTSLPGVAVGSALRVRQPTSSSYTTASVQTVTLTHATAGTASFPFTASTVSNVVLPTVSLPATASMTNGGATNMGPGTSSHRFTLAMRFIPTQLPASTNSSYALYGHGSGANQPVSVRLLPSGKIRIAASSASGAALITANWDSSIAVQAGHEYLLIISVDLAAGGGACTAKAWDLTDGTSHLGWGAPSVIDGVLAFDQNHWVAVSYNPANGAAPKVSFVYLDRTLAVDAGSSAAYSLFANAYLGPNGEGPTGVKPLVFLAGPAADWTASGGINRGTGLKFTASGSGVADVESPVRPYPPVLDLQGGPHPVNTPVTFIVRSQGYGVALTVTPSSSKAGTWSASPVSVPAGEGGATLTFTPTQTGVHTITFTNSAGYNNPAPQTLSVI